MHHKHNACKAYNLDAATRHPDHIAEQIPIHTEGAYRPRQYLPCINHRPADGRITTNQPHGIFNHAGHGTGRINRN